VGDITRRKSESALRPVGEGIHGRPDGPRVRRVGGAGLNPCARILSALPRVTWILTAENRPPLRPRRFLPRPSSYPIRAVEILLLPYQPTSEWNNYVDGNTARLGLPPAPNASRATFSRNSWPFLSMATRKTSYGRAPVFGRHAKSGLPGRLYCPPSLS